MIPKAFYVELPDRSKGIGWIVEDRPNILTAEDARRAVAAERGAEWLDAIVGVLDEQNQWYD